MVWDPSKVEPDYLAINVLQPMVTLAIFFGPFHEYSSSAAECEDLQYVTSCVNITRPFKGRESRGFV